MLNTYSESYHAMFESVDFQSNMSSSVAINQMRTVLVKACQNQGTKNKGNKNTRLKKIQGVGHIISWNIITLIPPTRKMKTTGKNTRRHTLIINTYH